MVYGDTYATGGRCADVEGSSWGVAWVTHEDDGLDVLVGGSRDGRRSAGNALVRVSPTAQSVVEDLTTLLSVNMLSSIHCRG